LRGRLCLSDLPLSAIALNIAPQSVAAGSLSLSNTHAVPVICDVEPLYARDTRIVIKRGISSPEPLENIRIMASFKQQEFKGGNPPSGSRGYALWYYQLRGGHYYFRLAPLGLALLVVPVILALVAIVILFLYRTHTPIKEPDITITTPPAPAEPPTKSVIKPAPPPPTPPRVYRSNINSINPTITPHPKPSRNVNGQ
jgi:hypothetical protein